MYVVIVNTYSLVRLARGTIVERTKQKRRIVHHLRSRSLSLHLSRSFCRVTDRLVYIYVCKPAVSHVSFTRITRTFTSGRRLVSYLFTKKTNTKQCHI